ncbi:MoaD/ThiS family protein [Leifsonia kafniensis]|uniref:MoaD/ThiS family protein n=1 Tax=Leifsonia kafniensis TaxID=475957 RepID=A0ABP7KB88_9MICO
MQIRYFAAAADAAGCEEEGLVVADEATLGTLMTLLGERYGSEMRKVVTSGSFLIDQVVRRDPHFPLSERIDVLPPFAGG